jgi:predicted amidohydrolase YtcJ
LRLAVTLDHEKKYAEALTAAQRSVALAGSDANVLALAQQEQTRLQELVGPSAKPPASR